MWAWSLDAWRWRCSVAQHGINHDVVGLNPEAAAVP